ncbi:MAG: FtsW/RodA/SpoVE family cell cycle protein [Bacteroidales bacterium]|nr:FtsW/RodA/SpoVE family cell cycle protein [Bacteroidales bacterium]
MNLPTTTIKSKGRLQGDMVVWMVLIMLCAISLIEVYSASSRDSYQNGQYWAPMLDHGLMVLGGLAVAYTAHLMPCKFFKPLCAFLVIISIGLLIYALFFGEKINGADRWIRIFGRTIQPSEFAKLSTIGFVSFLLTMRNKENGEAHSTGVKIAIITMFIMCALIASENFSTAGLLFVVIMALLWIGQAPKKILLWITLPLMGLALAGYITAKSMSIETARSIGNSVGMLHRLPVWVARIQDGNKIPEDPKKYDVANNQQVAHAQIAIATSNVVGRGPGKSVERDYLPMAFSDYIYAIIIEEGGIESALFVLFLYLLLLYRAWRIASKCVARFPAYLVMGLSLMLVLQALINMGVAVGLLPVTGQPLPLVSKGGTSTIITCAYIGMILSVSRSARQVELEEANIEANSETSATENS